MYKEALVPQATNQNLDTLSINAIRTLSMDAIQAANSGHPGLPLGAAPMAYVLWQHFLKHNPHNPQWFNRDRFILSPGHGSMLLYSLLHLTGYDLSLDDIKDFRQLLSRTPGHPERLETPGVEVSTGPLGQGFANGVGIAVAEAFLAATFNTPEHRVVDHYTYAIVSDGDVVEGVAMEAAAIAGNLKLGKLIYLYDCNHITLAASSNITMTENVGKRFEALNWHVQEIDGMDTEAVDAAIRAAQQVTDKPSLIVARTVIGAGSPNKAGTFSAHGAPLGADEVALTKDALGVPNEPFFVPDEVTEHMRQAVRRGEEAESAWNDTVASLKNDNPELAAKFDMIMRNELPEGWDADIPTWQPGDKPIATRKASGAIMNAFYKNLPNFVGGDADLNPSTITALKNGGDFGPASFNELDVQGAMGPEFSYAGRNIHFGIREHGMAGIVNGMAAHGGIIPFGSTFLVFTDYCRPSIRLSAISHLRSIFVMTHDSIAVGEDGPTHEPVEHVMSLRLIPRLTVLRPADANETAAAWRHAITSAHYPCVIVLTRQDLSILDTSGAKGSAEQGAYILADTEGTPDIILLATGSEVELAVMARETLAEQGVQARVVSMPSWEIFDQQDADYKTSVLGEPGTARLSIEAGVTTGWEKYTGDNGRSLGVETFGLSAPGKQVLKYFGLTREHVAAEALRQLGKSAEADAIDVEFLKAHPAGAPMTGADGHS